MHPVQERLWNKLNVREQKRYLLRSVLGCLFEYHFQRLSVLRRSQTENGTCPLTLSHTASRTGLQDSASIGQCHAGHRQEWKSARWWGGRAPVWRRPARNRQGFWNRNTATQLRRGYLGVTTTPQSWAGIWKSSSDRKRHQSRICSHQWNTPSRATWEMNRAPWSLGKCLSLIKEVTP